jgi:hypothetical protein
MKIPFCSPVESRRFTNYLQSRYGISYVVMKDWRWIRHKESVFVVTKEWEGEFSPSLNIFSMGLLVFSNASTFEPTSNFITLLGGNIRQNSMIILPNQVDFFFARKKFGREEVDCSHVLSDGFVAVSLVGGKVIGSAQLTRNHLIPNLPPTHHAKENDQAD